MFFDSDSCVLMLPTAYSVYAIFEWSLILLDIAFDSIAVLDLKRLEIRVLDLGEGAATSKQAVCFSPRASRPKLTLGSRRLHLAPPLAGSEQHKMFALEALLYKAISYTSDTRAFLSQAYLGRSTLPLTTEA